MITQIIGRSDEHVVRVRAEVGRDAVQVVQQVGDTFVVLVPVTARDVTLDVLGTEVVGVPLPVDGVVRIVLP